MTDRTRAAKVAGGRARWEEGRLSRDAPKDVGPIVWVVDEVQLSYGSTVELTVGE